tara:strand:+ start:1211 stop:1915 length:705 start_codon:yes stop_codon:yes gene_type:complete
MTKKKFESINIEGVIFDLDGVITNTATIHMSAWKATFNDILKNIINIKFTNKDYYKYIDGKPRLEGIITFLKIKKIKYNLRLIDLINKKKNILFRKLINKNDIKIYKDSINLIKRLKKNNKKIALASSSKNCRYIIRRAGIYNLFDYIIDGSDLEKKKLKGKPNPKIFLEAIKNLNINKKKTAIIEDSASGMKAAYKTNVKFPIGISRKKNDVELKKNGAKIVLRTLNHLIIKK